MMNKNVFLLVALLGLMSAQPVKAGTDDVMIALGDSAVMSLSEIIANNLPVLYVQTVNNVEPPFEMVYAPPGCQGATSNAEKVPGRMIMYKRINGLDSVIYDTGDYEDDVSGMSIRIRGNTSAKEDKKPYKIKLEKKKDLFLRENDSIYKDKDWLLLVDDHLLTTTGFRIGRLVGMTWTPEHHYVNLIINNRYRGIYLLCESVKRNPKCRLNVDKDSGFIYECDIYWWNEDVYVNSPSYAPLYNYTFKYPDEDDITQEQLDYMQGLVAAYEAALDTDDYVNMIDMTSFASWTLVHDLMGTKDGGGANRYFLKYDTTSESKIIMPLVWDFDLAERIQTGWSRCHERYMNQLFNNPNRAFTSEFVRVWCGIRETLRSDIQADMNKFLNSEEGRAMATSYNLNNITWDKTRVFSNQLSSRIAWFWLRYIWLDGAILDLRVPNDVNLDGVVDVSDVTYLIGGVLGQHPVYDVIADLNGDEAVDVADVTSLIESVLSR